MKNIAIIGSGSWGVALGVHLASVGNNVKIWSFMEEERDIINNEKKCKFLPGLTLPDNIYCSTDFEEVIKDTDFIIHVTPSKFTRNIFRQYKNLVENRPIIICGKGFEKESLKTLDEVILEEMPEAKVGVLSGPSHAEEVSIAIPTALVVASKHPEIIKEVQETFMSEKMRIYTSDDVKGVELGGALKNIIAFCAGAAAGIGLGDNSFAALITRGLKEITRLGIKLGGKQETFYGLSGLGDLIVTCSSVHSRNFQAGYQIGKENDVKKFWEENTKTVEGVRTAKIVHEIAKKNGIDMPICEQVYQILYNGKAPNTCAKDVMLRDLKEEF